MLKVISYTYLHLKFLPQIVTFHHFLSTKYAIWDTLKAVFT
jgi:hypothetical protein